MKLLCNYEVNENRFQWTVVKEETKKTKIHTKCMPC